MGNCNCLKNSSNDNLKKNYDIFVEGNNNDNNPIKKNNINNSNLYSSNILVNNNNNNNNNSNIKSLQRKLQNPSQSNKQKTKIKSRFDSDVLEMDEINSLEGITIKDIKKQDLSTNSYTTNNNINNKYINPKNPHINTNLSKKNLNEILEIKIFNKEFHKEKNCINIVFLGEKCCGKSSIVFQYMNNKFEPYYIQTMFKESFTKEVFYEEKKVNLNIIVTSGVEQYQEDYTKVYKNCDYFVVCYDVTSNESFFKAKDVICNDLLPYVFLYNENYSNIFLIGNKTDLRDKCVDVNKVMEFTMKNKIIFYESSAKNNNNIACIFNKIIELYHEAILN